MFEGYDLDSTAPSDFGNLSTHALVQTGPKVMIAGIIAKGPNSRGVIIRGLNTTGNALVEAYRLN